MPKDDELDVRQLRNQVHRLASELQKVKDEADSQRRLLQDLAKDVRELKSKKS